jgi:hypothetical protein
MFLIPLSLVLTGLILLYIEGEIGNVSRGMWLAMLWTSLTFAMFYYAQHRIQNVLALLQGIIPDTDFAKRKEGEVRARAFSHFNNRLYYLASAATIAITFPIMYPLFVSQYPSALLQLWSAGLLLFIGFVGGYGMLCGVLFNRIVKELIENAPLKPNPYHPDLFMGLKPLGSLSVANALVASSSSLLFPLIFEAIAASGQSAFLGYFIFAVIMTAILTTFFGPLFIVKNKIEREKFQVLIVHEMEYQKLLSAYKQSPSQDVRNVLDLLRIEKEKLKEIRLFPFESKMMFQIIASILLPIFMLLLQIYFKQ